MKNNYIETVFCHHCHKTVRAYRNKSELCMSLELAYLEYSCPICKKVIYTATERFLTTKEVNEQNHNAMQIKPNLWVLMD